MAVSQEVEPVEADDPFDLDLPSPLPAIADAASSEPDPVAAAEALVRDVRRSSRRRRRSHRRADSHLPMHGSRSAPSARPSKPLAKRLHISPTDPRALERLALLCCPAVACNAKPVKPTSRLPAPRG